MKPFWSALGLAALLAAVMAGCRKAGPKEEEAKLAIPDPVQLSPVGPGVHQLTVTMPSGVLIHYTLSVPLGYNGTMRHPLIVALHYSGEVTPFYGRGMIDSLVKPAFDQLRAIAVAPDALDGGDWTSLANETAVVWLTRCLQKSYACDPKRVLLTGFSMGGQGTWYLAARHQDLFTAALPMSGFPVSGDAKWNIPVYVIHSQNDEVVPLPPTQKQVEVMKTKGANVELRVIAGVSHYQTIKFAGPLREAVPWLKQVWGMGPKPAEHM
jgi:predicted peptidase